MAIIDGTKGADTLTGTTLQDVVMGQAGDDVIDAGDGDDSISAGAGNDKIFGGDGNDWIDAGSGDDVIDGGNGDDVIYAREGNDTVIDSAGNDYYQGGKGFDTIDFSNSTAGVTVDLSKGIATGNGTDTVQGFEKLIGSNFADYLKGSNDADVIMGGGGNDTIRGMGGVDDLTGGSGADTFVWKTADVLDADGASRGVDNIWNFGSSDRFDVSEMLKGASYTSLNDVIRFTDNSTGSTLQVKVNGSFVDVANVDSRYFGGSDIDVLASDGMFLT